MNNMKKTNKSKKSLVILALSIITLAFFAACTNPLLPGPKKKPNPNRETGEVLSVSIAAAFDADGKGVTLTAEVTGGDEGELSYQWYRNRIDNNEEGTAIPDETTENYKPPVDTEGITYYYVEATNILNGKTFEAVSGTVGILVHANGNVEVMVSEIETPTVTISTANDGGKVTLNAAASVGDGGELSYQWYSNTANSSEKGKALAGETKSSYTPPVTPNGTTYYYVKATNTRNGQTASAVSHTVKITVQGGAVTEAVVSDTIETPVVIVTAAPDGANNVILTASASVNDGGELSYRWYKNTLDSSKGGTFVAGATDTTFTPPMSGDGDSYYYVKVTNSLRGQTASAVSNTARIIVQGGAVTEWIVSATVESPLVNVTATSDGASVTLTAAASVTDGGTLAYQWYKNTVDNSKNGSLVAGATRTTYTPPVGSDGTTFYYVKVTNALRGQTADATSNTVKIIVQSGGITEFVVSDSVKTPSVTIAGSVVGGSVTITATASVGDSGTLSFQWYRNTEEDSKTGTAIAGAIGRTYAPSTASATTTYYYVRVTNTLKGQTASATSNIVGVTVHEGSGIIEIIEVLDTPTVSIVASVFGRNVTITATASVKDGGTLTYQWFRNNQNNRNGTEIAGATAAVYEPSTGAVGTTYYYVRVTNNLNGKTAVTTSNIVSVVVPEGGGAVEVIEVETADVETPVVTIAANVAGRDVTITATATVTDGGELSYQWFRNSRNNKDGTEIFGATEVTYMPPTDVVGTAYYYVKATNALNGQTASATSNIVGVVIPEGGLIEVIEVEAPIVSILTTAGGPFVMGGNVVITASATVSDGGYLSYQWYRSEQNNTVTGTPIEGATGPLYTVPTEEAGRTYYYVKATNTLQGKTASAFSNVLEILVNGWEIASVEVKITVPVKGAIPDTSAYKEEAGYTTGPVAWTANNTPVSGNFLGGAVYTATVTLTAQPGFSFNTTNSFTGKISGLAATVTNQSAASVTLSHTFNALSDRTVNNVTVKTQPTKNTYYHGEALDLTGLVVTITYDDGEPDEGSLADLAATNITTSPSHGDKLNRSTRDGHPVEIVVGGSKANTGNLTVDRKGLTVTGVSHTKVYDSNTTMSAVNLTQTQFTGIEFNENITGINGVTGTYISADAGTATVNIPAQNGTMSGNAAVTDNYTVAASSNVTVTGGITKANPTVVTGPTTGLTATYGDALSTITIPGTNNGSAKGVLNENLEGTFAWTIGTTLVGDAGTRAHSVTFTPTGDSAKNYNTGTGNASVTVSPKAVTISGITTPNRTLSPLDTTATFSLTVNGLVGSNAITVNLASNSYGLSLTQNNTDINSSASRTVTITYNGTTVESGSALSVALISGSGNYTVSGNPTVAPTVNDGQASDRAIPVTSENITRSNPAGFNSYANTATGLTRHYKLMADIPLTAPAANQSNWTPIGGSSTSYFAGSFDGQGKTITGLVIRTASTSSKYMGMFGYISGANMEIKNLGLKNVTLRATNEYVASTVTAYVGGVAGYMTNGMVEKCYVTGAITGINESGRDLNSRSDFSLGGVVGYMIGGTVQNCYSTASLSISDGNNSDWFTQNGRNVGGVVGRLDIGTVQNCYTTGSVSNTSAIGGVVGSISSISSYTQTLTKCVALNSSITTTSSNNAQFGRVYYGSPSVASYNYGKTGITMTYNNGSNTYTPTSSLTGKDGADTSTWNTQNFWTTSGNWGGTAWSVGTGTANIWEWSSVVTRPILRGFTANIQTN